MTANNYTELNNLRSIQDEIMEAVAQANSILEHSLPIEEMRILRDALNEKQQRFRKRLHEHLRVVVDCIALLEELEEREDLLQQECLAYLEADQQAAREARYSAVRANRRLTDWISRNVQALKVLLPRGVRA